MAFDCVWSNGTDDECTLMTRMATREGSWTADELIGLKTGVDIGATLKRRKCHE